jgi:hypothetical protein
MSVMSRPRQVNWSSVYWLYLFIDAQYGRQEAWTTVDQALIRGLRPHDQGSSWGFLCLANARRMVPASNPHRGFPDLPSLPSALGAELCLSVVLSSPFWPLLDASPPVR